MKNSSTVIIKDSETSAGTTFVIKSVNVALGIGNQLTNFKEQIGKVDPGIEVIEFIAEYNWGEMVKWMNITKK